MINDKVRRKKRADREKTRECQRSATFSGKSVDVLERFCLQFETLRSRQERGPTPASIWTSKPKREQDLFGPILVVLKAVDTDSGAEFLVAEVSESVEEAMESDLVLRSDESGLPFNCMIRSSRMFWTSLKWFKDCIGEIDPSMWHKILNFVFRIDDFDDHISPLDYHFIEIGRATFMRRDGITSGLPVEEADPRPSFSMESMKRCQYLSQDVTLERKQIKIDDNRSYDKLWIGNRMFPMESLESHPGVLRIKGRLVLQDITVPIYREKATGGGCLFRIEGEDVSAIELPLAAFEDLRDSCNQHVDSDAQTKSFSPCSCEETLDVRSHQTVYGIDIHLDPVLACRVDGMAVQFLADDSTTAIFLQLV